ncbi:MAG: MFS transporter [Deltaproteobacteria bacterium]|nr:MFS transporter [Deltaproteobacteria bacterium]
MKRSPLLPIFLIVLVDVLGLTIILPLLAFYAETLGATPVQVGLLTSTYAACQLISGPLLGRASDVTGRKPLLIVSQLGTFIGFVILAKASALWMVFLSRVIDGSTAGNLTLAQAYIADNTPPQERAKSFAVIGIAFGVGFLIGPAISGEMAHRFGYSAPVWLAAGLSMTSVLCTTFLLPGTRPAPESHEGPTPPAGRRLALLDWGSYAVYFKRPVLAARLLQFFLFCAAFASFTSAFALFAERRLTWHGKPFGPHEVGLLFAYSGFLGIILQGGLMGRLVKRFGEVTLVRVGFLSSVVGYTLLAFTFNLPTLVLAATVSSFGNGVLRPNLTAILTHQVGRNEQGTLLGLTQSLLSVAQIVAPIIAGFLIHQDQLAAWGLFAAVLAAAAIVIAPREAKAAEA